jgi:hypothetical protein
VHFERRRFFAVLLAGAAMLARPAPASPQLTPADSAAVLLRAAQDLEASQWEVSEALYRLISERYPTTDAALTARSRLAAPPAAVVYGSGTVELEVWMTLYGSWLGIAVPAAFGADHSEAYGAGLLVGGPSGFLGGRALAHALDLTEGQARAITLGGTWGSWQGWGWREVLDIGTSDVCIDNPFYGTVCYQEGSSEEGFAAAIIGGLAGIGVGALLSHRDITPGTGTAVNFGSLWGTWFGVAGGILAGLEDDKLLAATLVGGDVGLVTTAILAPGWNVSRSRARLVSIAGVLGALGGAGIDLIAQPDGEKAAIAIPLAGSVIGLALGVAGTWDSPARAGSRLDAGLDGSLLGLRDGRLSLGTPVPTPTLVPSYEPDGTRMRPALKLELFRARF